MAGADWIASVTPVPPPADIRPGIRTVSYAAALTGGWAAIGCLIVLVIGHGIGVSFMVTWGSRSADVSWSAAILVPLIVAELFALVALIFRGWPSAGRWPFWLGSLLAGGMALVLCSPIVSAPWPTRTVVLTMMFVTWILVVPQISRVISDTDSRRGTERHQSEQGAVHER